MITEVTEITNKAQGYWTTILFSMYIHSLYDRLIIHLIKTGFIIMKPFASRSSTLPFKTEMTICSIHSSSQCISNTDELADFDETGLFVYMSNSENTMIVFTDYVRMESVSLAIHAYIQSYTVLSYPLSESSRNQPCSESHTGIQVFDGICTDTYPSKSFISVVFALIRRYWTVIQCLLLLFMFCTSFGSVTASNYVSPSTMCGEYRWCYDTNISSIIGNHTSSTVVIGNTLSGVTTYYDINFKIIDNHCVDPSVDVAFEEIDFYHFSEYFNVSGNDGSLIRQCTGQKDNCGTWLECMKNQRVGVDVINQGDIYTINVIGSSGLNVLCDSYSLHVEVTFHCSGNTVSPTLSPSLLPTSEPIETPSISPTVEPTWEPSTNPTSDPTNNPSTEPTINPSLEPTFEPIADSTVDPTKVPTQNPSITPTIYPSYDPTGNPSLIPTYGPMSDPSLHPSINPTSDPTYATSRNPTMDPTSDPTMYPIQSPTSNPSSNPTYDPTRNLSLYPSTDPISNPTKYPTADPTANPTLDPIMTPTQVPSMNPTNDPTTSSYASFMISTAPTRVPIPNPSLSTDPSKEPTSIPTFNPRIQPSPFITTYAPSKAPIHHPTITLDRTYRPSLQPTPFTTTRRSSAPLPSIMFPTTEHPTADPTFNPTSDFVSRTTTNLIDEPAVFSSTLSETSNPTAAPTFSPTKEPSKSPTLSPSLSPTRYPTLDVDIIYHVMIEMKFSVHNLTEVNKEYLIANTNEIITSITEIIEIAYFDKEHVGLRYEDFWVLIYAINGVDILSNARRQLQDYNYHFTESDVTFEWVKTPSKPLILSIKIECDDNNGEIIISKTTAPKFKRTVEERLRDLFSNPGIWFEPPTAAELANAEKLKIVDSTSGPKSIWPFDPILTVITAAGICFVCVIIAFLGGRKSVAGKREIVEVIDIKYPMVLSVAIGEYKQDPSHEEMKEVGTAKALPELSGIKIDIEKVVGLFGPSGLNYAVFPVYNLEENIKQRWDKLELNEFLDENAKKLEESFGDADDQKYSIYDGLIVIISCHGTEGKIISSDYKLIDRRSIIRRFARPLSRKVPRIFIFDCCSGSKDNKDDWRPVSAEGDSPKGFPQDSDVDEDWFKDEPNPDYRLVQINAAIPGYIAKMHKKEGSFAIGKIIKKIENNLSNGNRLLLGDILDNVEEELQKKAKQAITKQFNDKTRNIKFRQYSPPKPKFRIRVSSASGPSSSHRSGYLSIGNRSANGSISDRSAHLSITDRSGSRLASFSHTKLDTCEEEKQLELTERRSSSFLQPLHQWEEEKESETENMMELPKESSNEIE